MAAELFADLSAEWDPAIAAGVTRTVQTVIQANAVQLTSAITLWIILSSIATMFSRMSYQEWVYGASRAAFLGILLTAAGFSTWIQTPMMTTLPNWIATTVNGGDTTVTGPQQFDIIEDNMDRREATVLQQTSAWTPTGVADRLRAQLASGVGCALLVVTFLAWELARGLMGILVATTPFVLGFAMFQTTKHIAYNMGGMMVSLLIFDVMVSIALAIAMTVNDTYTNGLLSPGDPNVDLQITTMGNIGAHLFFGMMLVLILPPIASRIGHGVVPNMGGIVRVPANVTRSLVQGAARDLAQKKTHTS
jgi:hypothetical protein